MRAIKIKRGRKRQYEGLREKEICLKKDRTVRNYLIFVSSVRIKVGAPFSFQSSSGKGKQSVSIKDWINPQSDSFSIKQLFIGTAAQPQNWILLVRKVKRERERERESEWGSLNHLTTSGH